MNQQLLDYVNQARAAGMTDEQIKSELLKSGWQQNDVSSAFGDGASTITSQLDSTGQDAFINKWSWGGFLLYVFYFIGCRMYKKALLYFLGVIVPIFNIWLWIKSGLKGRKMVWESGKWQDFESYRKRQKLLDKIGWLLLLVVIILSIIFYVIGSFSNLKNANQNSGNPASSQEIIPSETSSLTVTPSIQPQVSSTPTPSIIKPKSNIPLEIIQATLTPAQLNYPFSNAKLKVVLRNNTSQLIKEYNYRFFLDEANYFGQRVGNELANIDPGTTYEMDASNEQGAISELAKSCDFFGLDAGSYHLHLKISTDTNNPLNDDTTGPQVTDKLIPFTLTTTCNKK